ncbi:MAG: YhdP family protein, partial [Oceanobacter sp.]
NEPETDANAKPANPTRLIVEGKMTGPVAEALAYFQQTPLQEVVNHGFDDWRGEGQLTGEMTLSMLLGEAVPEPDVKLRAWLEEDAVSLQGLNLEFTDISGVLDFDSRNGISSEQLQANLFGGPVQASITSTPGEAGFSTEIQANGRAQVADIRNWMPNVLLAPVSGDLGYNARFSFDTTNGHTELDIETPLDGTLIDYPEPFFKAANDVSQPLRVTMSIAATDAEPRVWMNFNDRVRGIFALNDIGVERGQVYIGSLEPYLPSDSGIEIRGELIEPVVAEPWWDSWVELQELALKPPYLLPAQSSKAATSVSSRAADGAVANNQTGSSPAVAENPVRSIDLKLPNLTAATIPVPKFHVTAGQSMGEWRFQVASDVVGGNVVVPASAEQPVLLNLDYVHLPPAEEPISDVPVEQSVGLDDQLQQLLAEDMLVDMVPGDLLPMNLNLKELFVGGLNLGSWKVESRPIKGGATIRILESDMKGLQISGDLRWLLQNKQHSTQVDTMQIRATNLADVQSAFRMEPMMDAKNGRASLSLSWLGSPMAFNPNSLNGMGSFRLENGVWKAEGAGAIRAFGLLNFDSISRRLQLDFSDVYKSGVAFDTVKAKAKIEEGRLTLVEPFISNGPGAKFLMSGSTDLVAETMDMKLAVTFPVTSSLPLVAVLAGFAAPVAASIYVTEKLIGDELERFTSASYDVRGSWSEPDMKIRGAFDNQVDGKKSKSLKDRVLSIFGLDEAE